MAPQGCKLLKGYRIQNITQTLELFKAAEEHYWDDALLRVLVLRYINRARNKSVPFVRDNLWTKSQDGQPILLWWL